MGVEVGVGCTGSGTFTEDGRGGSSRWCAGDVTLFGIPPGSVQDEPDPLPELREDQVVLVNPERLRDQERVPARMACLEPG